MKRARSSDYRTAGPFAILLTLGALAATLAITAPAGPAWARRQDPRAAKLANQAKQMYGKGEYVEAAKLFRQAFEADPKPLFLYNIGKCLEKEARYLDALGSYKEFLEQRPDAPNRKDVEATIRYLEEKVSLTMARLEVESRPSGAAVHLDGAATPAGRTPLGKWLEPGEHRVRLALDGHLPFTRELEMPAGKPVKLRIKLIAEDAPGTIVLQGLSDGAVVELDGRQAGSAPLKSPLEVQAGTHQIKVTTSGQAPFVAAVQVSPGATVRLEVPAPPGPPAGGPDGVAAGSRGDEAASGRAIVSGPAWAALGVGAAALATGGVFYVMASSKAEDARNYSNEPGATADTWQTKVDEANGNLLVSNIGLAVGAASLVTAGVLITMRLLDSPEREAAEAGAAQEQGPELGSLLLTPLPDGLAAGWSFRF